MVTPQEKAGVGCSGGGGRPAGGDPVRGLGRTAGGVQVGGRGRPTGGDPVQGLGRTAGGVRVRGGVQLTRAGGPRQRRLVCRTCKYWKPKN